MALRSDGGDENNNSDVHTSTLSIDRQMLMGVGERNTPNPLSKSVQFHDIT